ncbi:amino acid ABC transporter substrate-binding protein [Clostridium sp. DMHC 10]|uniref:ABC transporter substrate-binding protein n=1 Tax=Clostridium sp. DMHC 10 TaxID=747377 RepID=UPI00069EEE0B|nr:ABC transporter substrate-binding protein [Clostridium sp. DMHC 10]KOF57060.1 amino acid ABC transporter substrate-binding protein [Clostridium sp. DMHC 10]
MKKKISIILALMLCISLLAGCSTGSKGKDDSLDSVKKAGVIKVGLSDDYPPMEFRDKDNKIAGFDIDVANAVAKKLGVKLQIVTNAYDGIFLRLILKKFDFVQSTVSITDDRKKKMLFSDPYINGGCAIFLKTGDNSIKSPDDLKGKVVGCQAGTTSQDALSKLSGLKDVKKYEATTDAFLDLQNGRIAAVVADPMVGDYYMVKNPGKFKKVEKYLGKEPIGAAFRKNDKALKDAYQKAYNELKKDGAISKISNKWFGYDVTKSDN